MNNSLASLSVKDLKRAVALKERIEQLNKELASILGAPSTSTGSEAAPKKRNMSAAGREAIRRAAKARWAKWKAAQKKG